MKERPILFKAEMVRAILSGAKTQTRRTVNTERGPIIGIEDDPRYPSGATLLTDGGTYNGKSALGVYDIGSDEARKCCPYGTRGDRLWVRETWQVVSGNDRARRICNNPTPDVGWIEYAATPRPDEPAYKWRPSIFMPRWASRITLEITEVRVERLNDISRGDATAEGCPFPNMADGADSWVWVLSFRVIKGAP
jgi:hypothetical protein